MYIDRHLKYPLFLSVLKGTWIFMADFRKIRPVGAELFHANVQTDRQRHWLTNRQTERRTDMTKLTVVFKILRTSLKSLYQHALMKQDKQASKYQIT